MILPHLPASPRRKDFHLKFLQQEQQLSKLDPVFNPSKTLTYGPQINTLPMRCDSSATSTKSRSAGIKSSLTSVSMHKLPSGVLQLVKVEGLEMFNPTAPLCGSFGALPVWT